MRTPYDIGKDHIPKRLYPYTGTNTDCWDLVKAADRDPEDPKNIVLIYSQYSVPAPAAGEEYLHFQGSTCTGSRG